MGYSASKYVRCGILGPEKCGILEKCGIWDMKAQITFFHRENVLLSAKNVIYTQNNIVGMTCCTSERAQERE